MMMYLIPGPKVELNQKVINFMTVNAGESATKTLDIINHSDSDVTYQVSSAKCL